MAADFLEGRVCFEDSGAIVEILKNNLLNGELNMFSRVLAIEPPFWKVHHHLQGHNLYVHYSCRPDEAEQQCFHIQSLATAALQPKLRSLDHYCSRYEGRYVVHFVQQIKWCWPCRNRMSCSFLLLVCAHSWKDKSLREIIDHLDTISSIFKNKYIIHVIFCFNSQ